MQIYQASVASIRLSKLSRPARPTLVEGLRPVFLEAAATFGLGPRDGIGFRVRVWGLGV